MNRNSQHWKWVQTSTIRPPKGKTRVDKEGQDIELEAKESKRRRQMPKGTLISFFTDYTACRGNITVITLIS